MTSAWENPWKRNNKSAGFKLDFVPYNYTCARWDKTLLGYEKICSKKGFRVADEKVVVKEILTIGFRSFHCLKDFFAFYWPRNVKISQQLRPFCFTFSSHAMFCVIKRSFKAPNIIFYDSSLHWFLSFFGESFSLSPSRVWHHLWTVNQLRRVFRKNFLYWSFNSHSYLLEATHFKPPLTSSTNNAPQCLSKAAIYMTFKWDHTLTLGCWIILELLSQRSTNNNSSKRIFKSFTHAVCFVFSGFVLQQKRQSSVSRTRKKNRVLFSSSLSTLHVPL